VVRLDEGEASRGDVILLRAAHGALEGVTTDESGQALAGALVRLGRQEPLEAVSDSEGRFRFEPVVTCEPRNLKAELSSYTLLQVSPPRRMVSGGWEPVRVVLVPTGRLLLRLADASGGAWPGCGWRLATRMQSRWP